MTSAAMYDDDDDEVVQDEPLFERRMQVLALRNGGMTYRQIAKHFEISEPTARRDEQWALRYVGGQDIEAIINVQRSVVLDMRRANYRRMLEGDKDAATVILKGLDHEAKLLGLYAPVRVQTGPSHVEFSERAAQLIAEVAPNTLKELIRGTSVDPRNKPVEPVVIDADVEPIVADGAAPADGQAEPVAGVGDDAAADHQGADPAGTPTPPDWGHLEPREPEVRADEHHDGDPWSNI